MLRAWLTILLFCGLISLQAQTNKKAEQAYAKAYDYAGRRMDVEALNQLKLAVAFDSNFIQAQLMLAELATVSDSLDLAERAYKSAWRINPAFFPKSYLTMAEIVYKQGRYAEGLLFLSHFDRYQVKGLEQRRQLLLDRLRSAQDLFEHPVRFEPRSMGDSINSSFSEYAPVFTADGQQIVFTRRVESYDNVSEVKILNEDFFESVRLDSLRWSKAQPLPSPLNTAANEGAATISADGRYLFFAGCNHYGGLGSCDIYVSRRSGQKWSKPFNIQRPVNSGAWESQPSIAPDMRTLYFASNRPGGFGGTDLWKSVLQDDGMWSLPENLGPTINSSGNENSPFMHSDAKTLYFSSDAHPGLGGFDIFFSRKLSDTSWSTPKNIGYPINTHKNEVSLSVSADGRYAYFASDKGENSHDLYEFELYQEAKPIMATYMKGRLLDAESFKPLSGNAQILDPQSGNLVAAAFSDEEDGRFLVAIPSDQSYVINVSKPGYLFYSERIVPDSNGALPLLMDVLLQPLKTGQTLVLKNIFFASGAYTLLDASKAELQKLYEFMVRNPSIRVEISGHTDNTGTEAHNLMLSEQRAEAVYRYLLGRGIGSERMEYAGYGFRNPISDNDSESGRALNRRTEIKVL